MNLQKITLSLLIAFFTITAFADVSVKGYYRNDGTYVQPHHRSNPNSSTNDNWSTKGNTNPYTGEKGTRDHNNWQNNRW